MQPTFDQIASVIFRSEKSGCPAGNYVDDRNQIRPIRAPKPWTPELDVTPRKLEHKEKEWTSPSGNYYAACQAEDCLWGQLLLSGKRRKRHSDVKHHEPTEDKNQSVIEFEDAAEESTEEIRVSSDRQIILTAGQDDPEEIAQSDYEDSAEAEETDEDEIAEEAAVGVKGE
jgi:hypothetical protein